MSDDFHAASGLAYRSMGPVTGTPLVAFHGLPGSRYDFQPPPELLEQYQVRLITMDRPGYGSSSARPGYTFDEVAQGVQALLDDLGVIKFQLLGFSGGAPHALTLAHLLPQRAEALHLFAPLAPLDGGRMELLPEASQQLFQLAAHDVAVAATQLAAMIPSADILYATFESLVSEVDRQLFQSELFRHAYGASFAAVMEQGMGGMAEDLRVCAQPWGFALDDVQVSTQIWQGATDLNTPPLFAEYLQSQLPDASLQLIPDQGHYLLWSQWPELLQRIFRG